MRIKSINITNLAAFPVFATELHGVTLVTGKHGAGKSSLERVIMYGLGRRPLADKGGKSVRHDPGILHGNTEKGELLIAFSDDSSAEYFRCRVDIDSTERKEKMRGARKWEDAGEFLDDITSALSYDPMAFKDLSEKERLEAFLKVAAVEIGKEEFILAVGGAIPTDIPERPSLEDVNGIQETIFKARTVENQNADRLAKHATELEAAIPPAPIGALPADTSTLRADLETLNNSEQEEILRIGRELAKKREDISLTRQHKDNAVSEEIDKKITALREKIAALNAEISDLNISRQQRKGTNASEAEVSIQSARDSANAEATEIKAANVPFRADLTARIATAEERERNSVVAETTRKNAEAARAGSEAHKLRSKAMSEALDRLTALKATVASRMAVKGVTIAAPREGLPVDICREEKGSLIPFSRWNDADKDAFALRMAILNKRQCGLVCVDNMGNFSPARREQVIQRCRELAAAENMQFLLGVATDEGDLRVVNAG
jgi:DNA repair exonuclease SbcCD ATPase subunit